MRTYKRRKGSVRAPYKVKFRSDVKLWTTERSFEEEEKALLLVENLRGRSLIQIEAYCTGVLWHYLSDKEKRRYVNAQAA